MNLNDILAVATNLTESEFESFCKGASIYFMSKSLKERDQQRKGRLIKQMRFLTLRLISTKTTALVKIS